MKSKESLLETVVHGIFLILGLITVGCVLLITVYLVISGVPAIAKIGLFQFLFGTKWASTASEPSFGILPFIMTSWCSSRIFHICLPGKDCITKGKRCY